MSDNNLEKSKQELIAEIDRRIGDKIIEKSNADLLKKLINNAETLTEAVAIAELGTTYRRTGLHFDKRLEKFGDTIKYFEKNEELSFKTSENGITHKLIIGDNYDALLNLLIEYRGKIDVIYIDPPYGKDSMGEFADTNYDNAITRDNLLSMLYPRLVLARQLLSDEGVIFCSIDDKNQAYVKCLFDSIFGEINFISCICREAIKGGSASKNIKQVHDYVLVYAKQLTDIDGKYRSVLCGDEFTEEADYAYEDDKGKYGKGRELNKWGAGSRREDSPSMWFPIYTPDGDEVYPIRNDGSEGRWRWGKQRLLKAVEDGDVLFEKRDDGTYVAYEKIREDKVKHKQLISILKGNYINAGGSDDLKNIFNTLMSPFDYAKPTSLIEELLRYLPTDDFIALDFFAGSGTTGQAVLDLNRDGGTRKFILCQSDEKTKYTPNGVVSDVTSKRLKRIMTGTDYDGTDDFEWIKNNEPFGDNLDVYNIKTVANFEATTGKTPFDVIDETLYGKEKMNVNDKIKWVCENFDGTQKLVENDNEYKKRTQEAE